MRTSTVATLFLLGSTVNASEDFCKYDEKCHNVYCKLRHGKGRRRPGLIGLVAKEWAHEDWNCLTTGPYSDKMCHADYQCTRRNCSFAHKQPICMKFLKREPHKEPWRRDHPKNYDTCRLGRHLGKNPEFMWPEAQTRDRGSRKTRTKRAPAKGKRACRNGDACYKRSCTFSHPSGDERDGLKQDCRNGDDCWNKDCSRRHLGGDSRRGLTGPPRTCYRDENCNEFTCQYTHTQGWLRVGLGRQLTQRIGSTEYWNGGAAFGGMTRTLNGWEDNYSVASCENNYGGDVTEGPVLCVDYFNTSYPWEMHTATPGDWRQ